MQNHRHILRSALAASGLLLSLIAPAANATLVSFTANGVDLVNSSASGVIWLKDADLLGTWINAEGYTTIYNRIVAASPTVDDPYYGQRTIGALDLRADRPGRMSWWGAYAMANYLNSIAYGGLRSWRLPTSYDRSDEFYRMVTLELGGVDGYAMPDTDIFDNERVLERYWAYGSYQKNGTQADTFTAWANSPDVLCPKYFDYYGWFVAESADGATPTDPPRDLPEPSTVSLLLAALAALSAGQRLRRCPAPTFLVAFR